MSETVLRHYFNAVEKYYKAGKATEHSYRSPLQKLLEELDTNITATNESKRVKCGAPDYVVERHKLTIGYIEAKDIGLSLDKIEQDEIIERYRHALDNLILTDYLEFRWYVGGERRMTASLGVVDKGKNLALDKEGIKQVEDLLKSFLEHSAEPIRKPQELARRMARLTCMIRDIIINAFTAKEVSHDLHDLYAASQEVLLSDLTQAAFADMFAQTLVYGLFAARYNHKGRKPFSRSDAAKEIPRTNPFLRRLFGSIAGPMLDDEPFVGFVDELAQVLAYTDIDEVMADFGKKTRQEDPIVYFYETFLAQYDPEIKELRGVYYTPEPVVSYIVRSIDSLLRTHFDCPDGLADTETIPYSFTDEEGKEHTEQTPRVLILDPATGTATFLYHVIAHIRESYRQAGNAGMWSSYVREHLLPRLFGFELLMAPYAMAHLKLGMQLAAIDLPASERATWAYDFQADERLGIYLTNTLDEALKRSQLMFGRYISDEANEAAKVKRGYPVMVVLGNPPYAGHSANKGQWINDLLRGKDSQTGASTDSYFKVDGQPLRERNPKWLNDDYVKFIRFAQWRIEQTGYGILAFITNHGYIANLTFRGMRQSLMRTFDDIYVLNLHGSVKKRERSPDGGKDENVFDIRSGVAIGIFVKRRENKALSQAANVYYADLWGPRKQSRQMDKSSHQLTGGKYSWLVENDITTTEWTKLAPEAPFYLFMPQNTNLRAEYEIGRSLAELMPVNVLGFQTHRDHFAIDFDKDKLDRRIDEMRNTAIANQDFNGKYNFSASDSILSRARQKLQKDPDWQKHFIMCLYRPFDQRFCYFSDAVMDRPRKELIDQVAHRENVCILSSRQQATQGYRHSWVAKKIANDCVISTTSHEANQIFPLYLYHGSDKSELFDINPSSNTSGDRHPNLQAAFIAAISRLLKMDFVQDGRGDLQDTFGPEDVFNYIYAILNAPTYRERYAEFLKVDFPRLPLTSNADLFRTLCKSGARLVELHLLEKFGKITTRFPISGNNIVEKVSYTCDLKEPEKGCVWINKTQHVEGIRPDVWDFRVGGYQVCEKWLKDRKGRQLTFSDLQHYQRVVAALTETITLMGQIDEAIEAHGGWPIR
ncbi:MAG TPA: type ISP restriction/modification enzyme [Ktedonobacteraceae bacterium]|nr:type ISP restriction/modification enzyme [Ktedonobacteraceae bacterium]